MRSISIFNELNNECDGDFYQTKPLAKAPNLRRNIIHVGAVIYINFVNSNFWEFECQKGSLTFRQHFHENCDMCKKSQHKVIKIFIDFGNKLARMEGVDHLAGENPIVIGIELGMKILL